MLNPSFWFITLIIQFYIFFPILRALYVRLRPIKFLLLMGLSAYLFTLASIFAPPLPGEFFGCWLLEFSFGMVMASNFDRFNKILSRTVTMIPLALAYALGFFLTSYPLLWPIARPIYGIALTLFIWTIYNVIKRAHRLNWIVKALEFVGLNSYALYLINQPLIQDYFLLITSFTHDHIYFINPVHGSRYNYLYYPIGKYILILLSYISLMIFIAYILTKVDNQIRIRLTRRVLHLIFPRS